MSVKVKLGMSFFLGEIKVVKKKFLNCFFIVCCLVVSVNAFAKPKVIWTAVFGNVTPRNENVSKAYCLLHTPTVMVTTIEQITSKKGVKTLNGLYVKYLSYKNEKKDGLLFNIVDATVSGHDVAGDWTIPMKLYEQTLSEEDQGVTWTVWSTKDCKGTFLGTPTIVD